MACTRNCQWRRKERKWEDESSNNYTKGQDLENIQKSSWGQVAIIAKYREGLVEKPVAAKELERSGFRGGEASKGNFTPHWAAMLWCSWHTPHAANLRTLLGQQQHLHSLGYCTHIGIVWQPPWQLWWLSTLFPLWEPPSRSMFWPQAVSMAVCPPSFTAVLLSCSVAGNWEESPPLWVI